MARSPEVQEAYNQASRLVTLCLHEFTDPENYDLDADHELVSKEIDDLELESAKVLVLALLDLSTKQFKVMASTMPGDMAYNERLSLMLQVYLPVWTGAVSAE